jgi:hypothetical protein
MPVPVRAALIFAFLAGPAGASEAFLGVHVHDADAVDFIAVRNLGGCDALSGTLRIDFAPSAGGVVIDTEYGGGGTLHPRGVEVALGPAEVAPVADGARALEIVLTALAPEEEAVILLDLDSAAGGIAARDRDIAGSVAEFSAQGEAVEAAFGPDGRAILTVPCLPPGLV